MWKVRGLPWHERRIYHKLTSFSVFPFFQLLQLLECLSGYMCGGLVNSFPWFTTAPPNESICNPKMKKTNHVRGGCYEVFCKTALLKIYQNLQRNTCASLFLTLLQVFTPSGLQLFCKKTPSLGFQSKPFVDLLFTGNHLSSTHPATRRRGNVVTTSLCTSQWRRRYVSNETPNNVSVERRQDVSVVHLHHVLLVCRDDVSWGRNDEVPSVRLHNVSNKSQMKHPMTSQWYVTKTFQWYVFTTSYWYVVMTSHGDVMTTSHHYVSTTSQTSLKWNTQWRLSGTSLRRLSGTYPPRPISTSLRRLL